MKRYLLAALSVLLLVGAWFGYRLIWGLPLDINHFADRNAIRMLLSRPELITMVGAIENTPLDFHSNRLSDFSPATEQLMVEQMRRDEQDLRLYDRDELEGQRRLTYDYLDWTYRARLSLYDFPYHFFNVLYSGPYPVNQIDGAQELALTTLSQFQQVVDEASAERYLERMAATPAFLDQLLSAVDHREAIGVVPPRVIVDRLIERAEALIAMPPSDWSAYRRFASQLAEIAMDDGERDALLARNLDLIEQDILPAYISYLAYLERLRETAPEAVGVWRLPRGLEYYQALLSLYTTTDMTPDEIHQLGLKRVAEIRTQMSALLVTLGYEDGSFEDRLQLFVNSPEAVWVDEPGVREEILAEYKRHNDELKAGTASAFRDMPDAPLEVRRVPPEEEIGSAGAFYRPPALDGSRPGVFYVNLRNTADTQRFAMRSLTAHEGIPGHHFDTITSQALTGLPTVRKLDYITAHGEGWALYAERLVAELDLHDAFSDMGRLQQEMFRAVRLVVDTGMHAQQWTREQAIDYMLAQTGMARGDVVSEIERYISMPGQACAYMVGMLEILALREEARQRQGEAFNLPDFHQVMLGNGALPLAVLRQEAERELQ